MVVTVLQFRRSEWISCRQRALYCRYRKPERAPGVFQMLMTLATVTEYSGVPRELLRLPPLFEKF